jgi:outer membrane protein
MRTFVLAAALALGLFLAPEAHAQFANRSIGLSTGYMRLDMDNLDWGVPVGIDASVYIENHFDLVFHLSGMLLNDPVLGRQFVGIYGATGVRYLFNEETLRPYAGLDLGYFQTFARDPGVNLVGLTPNLGLEWMAGDTWSLGVRGQFTGYWFLNAPRIQTSTGLHLQLSTWF